MTICGNATKVAICRFTIFFNISKSLFWKIFRIGFLKMNFRFQKLCFGKGFLEYVFGKDFSEYIFIIVFHNMFLEKIFWSIFFF